MMKKLVYYLYPKGKEMSFTYMAEKHIEIINEKYNVFPSTLSSFGTIINTQKFSGYFHPYFYPLDTVGEIKETLLKRKLERIDTLIGVDVADSNSLSKWAVDMANLATAFIVNSRWSYNAYIQSGVKVPVHIVYHGLENEWFREKRKPQHALLRFLTELKQKKNLFYILYFLWHSGYRKGADLALRLIDCIDKLKINYMLIIKKMDINDPALKEFSRYKTFIIEGRFPRDWLIDLYDIADLLLLPSRGGSFELNGIEALARGIPVLMPNTGAWTEYTPPGLANYLWVKTARMVPVLPGNTIHDGVGGEWDSEDACEKFIYIYTNYNDIKQRVEEKVAWIRENFSWNAIKPQLWSIHEKYFSL
jgi:glycosyltransferase involved in cell wall biosynthesis